MSANEKDLSDLHSLLAKTFRELLLAGEATPSMLNVIRAFLKDNGIDCWAHQNDDIQRLVEALPFVDPETDPCPDTTTPAKSVDERSKSPSDTKTPFPFAESANES